MSDADIVRRLDRMVGVLMLVHRDELERARGEIRSDKVNAAILDRAGSEVAAGTLKEAVKKRAKASSATVDRRLSALVEMGALERTGAGSHVKYRVTGLV